MSKNPKCPALRSLSASSIGELLRQIRSGPYDQPSMHLRPWTFNARRQRVH
jgi:hypothetical protein